MPDQIIYGQQNECRFPITTPMNHLQSPTSTGFTLIELLISISLGIGILYVAFLGVRVAAQTTTSIRRMALSNELLANGVHLAMEEIDNWESYDDPTDNTRQRLRASEAPASATTVAGGSLMLGLPFNRFNAGVPAPAWSRGSAQNWGNGWQDDERLWAISANNELTWWTGNKAETLESDCRFGHYTIFGISRKPNANPVLIDAGTSGRIGAWQPRHGGGKYGTIDLGTDTIAPPDTVPPNPGALMNYRRQTTGWLANQTRGLSNALGWYGMLDYLPPNAIICYSSAYSPMTGSYNNSKGDATDAAGRPIFLIKTFSKTWSGFGDKPYYMLQSFSPNWAPHAMDFLTSYTAYSLIPPNDNAFETSGMPLSARTMLFHGRSMARMEGHDIPIGNWGDNYTNEFMEMQDQTTNKIAGGPVFTNFVNRTSSVKKMMPLRPTEWPDISVSVARYLRLCRFSTQVKVSWSDPLTGATADLRFTAMGTTLRGARRNRNLDQ